MPVQCEAMSPDWVATQGSSVWSHYNSFNQLPLGASLLVYSFSQRTLPKTRFPWDSLSDPGTSWRLHFPHPGHLVVTCPQLLLLPPLRYKAQTDCLEPELHTCGWETVSLLTLEARAGRHLIHLCLPGLLAVGLALTATEQTSESLGFRSLCGSTQPRT